MSTENKLEESIGFKRVRVKFNPSGYNSVEYLKVKTADLINDLEAIKNDEVSKSYQDGPETLKAVSGEKLRLIALAQTAYEEATMWAVKALTI
jgi:hypothetical protein